jgi:hypothetical protein
MPSPRLGSHHEEGDPAGRAEIGVLAAKTRFATATIQRPSGISPAVISECFNCCYPSILNSMKSVTLFALSVLACVLSLSGLAQPLAILPVSTPDAEGVDPHRLSRMRTLLQGYVETRKHAGAVSLVARHGRIVDYRAYSYLNFEPSFPWNWIRLCASTQ